MVEFILHMSASDILCELSIYLLLPLVLRAIGPRKIDHLNLLVRTELRL